MVRHPDAAPCNRRTLQGATRQLRTLRLSHVATCDIALSHPANSACRTVRLKKPTFDPKNPVIRTRQCGHSPLPHHSRLPRHTAAIPPSTSIIIATSCGNILYTRSYTVRSEFIGPRRSTLRRCARRATLRRLAGRRRLLSDPCQCPFPDGGPAHSGHSQDIGVDFALRFGFAQNNQKRSQGATPKHRTLQSPNFAGCNSSTSHPATLSCRTLRHRAIAHCHFRLSHTATQKSRFQTPKITHLLTFLTSECIS